MYPGHTWYADQNGLGSGTCTASDVLTFRNEVRRHEGVGIASNSHAGVANLSFSTFRPDTTVEKVVQRSTRRQTAELGYFKYKDFLDDTPYRSAQTAFDSTDTPQVNASVSCTFDYNPLDGG